MLKLKKKYYFIILVILLLVSFYVGLLLGSSNLSIKESFYYLFNSSSDDITADIIWKIRIPRLILGILVGSGLAACGAAFQGLFRNPLAEPYTLGISSGASLGVSISVILGLSGVFIPFYAFIGSFISVFFVYTLASRKNFLNSTVILLGVIISFLFSSIVYLIFSLAKPQEVHNIIMWLMGDLSSANNLTIIITAILVILGIFTLIFFSEDLNILTLGDEKAFSLGVNPERTKRILFIASSFITGSCVAASGIIGFVGIIIPHISRKLIGVNHRYLIPSSALIGAIFLVLSDTIARIIIKPMELPVGVITGIIGGVFFLSLLLKTDSRDF